MTHVSPLPHWSIPLPDPFYGSSMETATVLLNNVEFKKVEVDRFVEVLRLILTAGEDVPTSMMTTEPTAFTLKAEAASQGQQSPAEDTVASHETSPVGAAKVTAAVPDCFEAPVGMKHRGNQGRRPSPTSCGVEAMMLSIDDDHGNASMDMVDLTKSNKAEGLEAERGGFPSHEGEAKASTQEREKYVPDSSDSQERPNDDMVMIKAEMSFREAAEAHAAGAY